MRCMAKMLTKHEAKPSAFLTPRPCAKCFISCEAQARQCFKEFPEKCFNKNMFANINGADLVICMSYNTHRLTCFGAF